MRKRLLYLLMLMPLASGVSAQDLNLPGLTSPKNVKVTDVGKMSIHIDEKIVTDSLTGRQDTVYSVVPEMVWRSENADFMNAQPPRRAISNSTISGKIHDNFDEVTIYTFKYTYESINSKGETVTLSGRAACPNPKRTSEVNNMLIGTHVTITADNQCPSNITAVTGSDVSLLFSLSLGSSLNLNTGLRAGKAAGEEVVLEIVNFFFPGTREIYRTGQTIKNIVDDIKRVNNYNFVVMPDYEGYGETKTHAHPYLYEELTARQVVDGAVAARYAYEHDAALKDLHVKFRSDWRTVVCGYSQGGAVAMATHRFIEQNHMDEELHFVGSICGDGPYDPMATLMYYVENDEADIPMSLPVVLPLIVKGMLDTNPYMRTHKAEDYFTDRFLSTGIMEWLTEKTMNSGDIEEEFKYLYNDVQYDDILEENGTAMMRNIMNEKCREYFTHIYYQNSSKFKTAEGIPLPTKRGVMEDLHLALASNDVTEGWTPSHHILLFHSKADTTVPYYNAERAVAKLGKWAVLHTSDLGREHVDAGQDFFAGETKEVGDKFKLVIENDLRVAIAIKKLIELPYTGQTAGAISEW